MKKILLATILVIACILAWLTWSILGPSTSFEGKTVTVYIPSAKPTRDMVMAELNKKDVLASPSIFEFLASRVGYWDKIKPGKYVFDKGSSILHILRKLKNGSQTPVRIVINKFRTREDLASYLGRHMEADSVDVLNFFNNPDSTRIFGLDTNNIVTAIIPNTYIMYWNTPTSKFLRRLYSEREEFWNKERMAKLEKTGLTKESAYILASIIEEETNKQDEKPIIASVYLNRMKKNMYLGADPTVKFALRNFALKRITLKHIRESGSSPYNTYLNKGLPPGPICTPSVRSIDAAISPAETDYLFFCAKADFSGYHSFASNEQDHFRNARAYQKALDSLLIK
jgi:peptidoglycan lytic transglycosylase G